MQHCIDTFKEGEWASCHDVQLRDGKLHCSLARDRYHLAEAYEDDLHIRFANATTDRELITFVRAWGPLLLNEDQKRSGRASFALSSLRTSQRRLRALLDLLTAFKSAEGEHEALIEFLEAEDEYARNPPLPSNEPFITPFLRQNFGINGDIFAWVTNADLGTVRAATDFLVSLASVGPDSARLICHRNRRQRYLEASWGFLDLEGAIRWMIWYDEFKKHPIVCCQECRTIFRPESVHARKYCSRECGQRAFQRVWIRKKRASERAGRK